ncbi:MAG TPA: pitrilysin family protein [Bacteroidales bacterium]|nr:pitrilysin family protein [Bacteroidales bacterium]HOR81699.1 pitrilysin family protein [Bacteroidales bacterium]HPJ91029.1 pitrilysin family protein [Bacteroidales bacterium]
MVAFETFDLNNGLRVILHTDTTTPLAAINLTYKVGSKNEHPDKTGFAHLFEHLMFSGSKHIPSYDKVLQSVGGTNNAFTNPDITNYYLSLPAKNLETALWLEADRMNELAFSEESLATQKNVVIEEFKQSYLNQPYGDIMLLLKPLAYKVHPYQWNTIGKDIEHIALANMEEVKRFFYQYYRPNNAILSVTGNINTEQTLSWVKKWFGEIPMGKQQITPLPSEPSQTEKRFLEVERNVPYDFITIAFHTCKRSDKEFYANSLLSDILSNGQSSRFQEILVNKKHIFSHINSYLTESFDNGLFIINGIPSAGISLPTAENAIWEQLEELKTNLIQQEELQKVKNKVKTLLYFSELSIQEKALSLCLFEAMDHAARINQEEKNYASVDANDMIKTSRAVFRKENSSTIYYKAIKQ